VPDNEPITPTDAPERRGMDRRTMIKAAGIAGAAAWSAPVIIDSLSSPAAAVTAPTGCHRFRVDLATMTFVTYTPPQPGNCTDPTDAGCTSYDEPANPTLYGLSVSPAGTDLRNTTTTATFNIANGYSCRILATNGDTQKSGDATKQRCASATGTGTSLAIAPTGGDTWTQSATNHYLRVLIKCP
jgi:hypothetical protein